MRKSFGFGLIELLLCLLVGAFLTYSLMGNMRGAKGTSFNKSGVMDSVEHKLEKSTTRIQVPDAYDKSSKTRMQAKSSVDNLPTEMTGAE